MLRTENYNPKLLALPQWWPCSLLLPPHVPEFICYLVIHMSPLLVVVDAR